MEYLKKITLVWLSLYWSPIAVASTDSSPSSTLKDFVSSVVEQHARVRAANASYDASAAIKEAASRPLYNPELSIDVDQSESNVRTIGISQSVDWADKREARTRVAVSNLLIAKSDFQLVRWNVAVELLNSLALWQTSLEQKALAESRTRQMAEFATLAERRFNAGDIARIEVDFARIAATNARIESATVAADLAEARQILSGLAPDTGPEQWPELPGKLPAISTETDYQRPLARLPDVQAARGRVTAANAVVELRRAERRPDPTFGATAGREGGESLVGLKLSIPLYIRNGFSHEVTAAEAGLEESQQLLDDQTRRSYTRLISAGERYRLGREAWEDWLNTGPISLESQSTTLRRLWESGELSTTEYLVQIQQILDVQANALDLRASLWRAWTEWLYASGTINSWLKDGGE